LRRLGTAKGIRGVSVKIEALGHCVNIEALGHCEGAGYRARHDQRKRLEASNNFGAGVEGINTSKAIHQTEKHFHRA